MAPPTSLQCQRQHAERHIRQHAKEDAVPLAQHLADNIRRAGKGALMYSCNVAIAYQQLPLNPADWPLICFSDRGRYYIDASLPFGMRWVADSCQDAMAIIASHLNSRGAHILNYINDFGEGREEGGWVASSKAEAQAHFNQLQATLDDHSLVEAKHKESPPSQCMTWLGLDFDSVIMTITILSTKGLTKNYQGEGVSEME